MFTAEDKLHILYILKFAYIKQQNILKIHFLFFIQTNCNMEKTTVIFSVIFIYSVIMLSVNVGITSAAPGMHKDHSGVAEILAAGIIIKMLDGGL